MSTETRNWQRPDRPPQHCAQCIILKWMHVVVYLWTKLVIHSSTLMMWHSFTWHQSDMWCTFTQCSVQWHNVTCHWTPVTWHAIVTWHQGFEMMWQKHIMWCIWHNTSVESMSPTWMTCVEGMRWMKTHPNSKQTNSYPAQAPLLFP